MNMTVQLSVERGRVYTEYRVATDRQNVAAHGAQQSHILQVNEKIL